MSGCQCQGQLVRLPWSLEPLFRVASVSQTHSDKHSSQSWAQQVRFAQQLVPLDLRMACTLVVLFLEGWEYSPTME